MEVDLIGDLDEGALEAKNTRKRLRKQSSDVDLVESVDSDNDASEVKEEVEEAKPAPKRQAKKAGSAETPKKKRKLKDDAEAIKRADHLQKFHSMTPEDIEKMQTNLLAWYDEVRALEKRLIESQPNASLTPFISLSTNVTCPGADRVTSIRPTMAMHSWKGSTMTRNSANLINPMELSFPSSCFSKHSTSLLFLFLACLRIL